MVDSVALQVLALLVVLTLVPSSVTQAPAPTAEVAQCDGGVAVDTPGGFLTSNVSLSATTLPSNDTVIAALRDTDLWLTEQLQLPLDPDNTPLIVVLSPANNSAYVVRQLNQDPEQQLLAALVDQLPRTSGVPGFGGVSGTTSAVAFQPCQPCQLCRSPVPALAVISRSQGQPAAESPNEAPAASASASSGGVSAAAIAVPSAILGTLLAAGAAALLLRRHRRRQLAVPGPPALKGAGGGGLGSGAVCCGEQTWQVEFSSLQLLTRLGEGSYGVVHRARWRETVVAVKLLSPPQRDPLGAGVASAIQAEADAQAEAELALSLQKEASIMSGLRHPNCVLYLGYCQNPACLMMEYCGKGSLRAVLDQAAKPGAPHLLWALRVRMAFDAAKGMRHLHQLEPPILHRDLKSPNLLVDDGSNVKVSDFGLSKVLWDQQAAATGASSASTVLRNARWMAPEVLQGAPHTQASDVYSFALVMWELLTLELPFADEADSWRVALRVMEGARPPIPRPAACVPPFPAYQQYVELMCQCWHQDAGRRPAFEQITGRIKLQLDICAP